MEPTLRAVRLSEQADALRDKIESCMDDLARIKAFLPDVDGNYHLDYMFHGLSKAVTHSRILAIENAV